MKKLNKQKLFTEQMRPKTLDDIVLLDRVRRSVSGEIRNNFIFAGSPGLGKTSLMRILGSGKGKDEMEIHLPSQTKIATILNTIKEFCETISFFGLDVKKYILLDEIDDATDMAFNNLRFLTEEYADVRFIATCNCLKKIPAAIKSRFVVLEFAPQNANEMEQLKTKYIKRIIVVAKSLELKFNSIDTFNRFFENHFPDMRSIMKELDNLSFGLGAGRIITNGMI